MPSARRMRAVRAVAGGKKARFHSFAFPGVAMYDLGRYSALMCLKCFEPATMAERHVGIGLREFT